jgi:hypothetical protein
MPLEAAGSRPPNCGVQTTSAIRADGFEHRQKLADQQVADDVPDEDDDGSRNGNVVFVGAFPSLGRPFSATAVVATVARPAIDTLSTCPSS